MLLQKMFPNSLVDAKQVCKHLGMVAHLYSLLFFIVATGPVFTAVHNSSYREPLPRFLTADPLTLLMRLYSQKSKTQGIRFRQAVPRQNSSVNENAMLRTWLNVPIVSE